MIYTDPATGNFVIETGGTNTAGNTVTRTPLITLTPSGNLGVLTSTPSIRLEVNGDINNTDVSNGYFLANKKTMFLPVSQTSSIAVGPNALASITATDRYNTAVGVSALNASDTGDTNTAVGYNSLLKIVTVTLGNNDVAVGYRSAENAGDLGYANSVIGYEALLTGTGAALNTAAGYSTLRTTAGDGSVAIGANTLAVGAPSDTNTAAGYNIAANASYAGRWNILIGAETAKAKTSGTSTPIVVVGHQVGSNTMATGVGNVLIGTSSLVDTATAGTSYFLNIGNLYSGDISNYHAAITNGINGGGTAPTVGSGATDCGTSPAIAGNDNVMKITVGSSTNGGKCTVTFASAWVTAPVCTVQNQTAAINMSAPVTTTTVTPTGSITAGDVINVHCFGYQM